MSETSGTAVDDEELVLLSNCTALLLAGRESQHHLLTNSSGDVLILSLKQFFSDPKNSELQNNFIECFLSRQDAPFQLYWWQKCFWICLFLPMLFVAVAGNIIVMWIVLAHRRMRTVTNYLLVNLSLADLLMSLLNCIFNFIFMVNSHWPFGAFYCTVNNFVANFTVADSVFTLVAISIDRYLAIVHPLKHRTSKKRALLMLLSVWLASTLLAIPCILYSTTMTKRYKNGNYKTICYMKWPDGQYPQSSREYIYNLIFLGFTYLIPVVSMAACYGVIGHHLWGSKSIGERTQRQLQAITAKRKVVRMLITVVSIFALCWLPYHSYFIFAYHNQSVAVKTYIQHIYLAFYWLAMSNAMVNPIIYYWMNKK
uniref:Neuropeptide GPCR A33 n=1 Tax=Nilaparvata lugens TaxID=108931 RepID=U3UA06_NILLU|nr:neuropeptide GPCR A33 [Nilaparvata lugens]